MNQEIEDKIEEFNTLYREEGFSDEALNKLVEINELIENKSQ